ncbi:receptor-type guanylate cyclase Gyc76C-like isoform X2 [Homarus americanus]|uniref:receptor-type guanylate cyclase Gyc76C-like isoform X2 n=1 Tax=Homarus americanus TaxID=6706 RepID=UPI001C48582F|nr:receptor-type guanylate cyclase Gyc76C-like isoform X2 [Homarus americanus]
MGAHGRCWWVMWGWDGGGGKEGGRGGRKRPPPPPRLTSTLPSPRRSSHNSGVYVLCLVLLTLVWGTSGVTSQANTTYTISTTSASPSLDDDPSTNTISSSLRSYVSPMLDEGTFNTVRGTINETEHAANWTTACVQTNEWPKFDNNTKSILVGFLLTRLGKMRERLGLKIPGAFSYAVEDVNNRSVLPENYQMRFEVHDTEGLEDLGSKSVVDLLCKGVSAIFGPEHTCYVEGTIAQGKNLPMISYGCSNERASRFTTFARTNPSEKYIIKTTVATLRHNNWSKFSIIYSDGQHSMMETLKEEASKENMTINHEIQYNTEHLHTIFQETKNETRIYVFIGHRNLVNELLTVMAMTGIFTLKERRKEYVLLFVEREEYMPNDWHSYIWAGNSLLQIESDNRCLERDLKVYDGAFMVVANRVPESKNLLETIRKYNKKSPFCLGYHPSFNRPDRKPGMMEKHIPYLTSAYLYDSVQLYARAVSELYAAQETKIQSVEEIAKDGARIKNHLKKMTYLSILGFNMTMNSNASSEGKYSVYYFSKCPDPTEDSLNCSRCLYKISDYYSENSSLMLHAEKFNIRDEPECGYDGKKCARRDQEYQKYIAGAMGGLLILFTFISTILYRNWKYEQEIDGLQWRIDCNDLKLNSHASAGSRVREAGLYSTSSSLTSRTSLASAVSYDVHGQWYQYLGNYKGTVVCLKSMPLNRRRPELTRNTMIEMRNMREMKQDNVCSFIGAYVELRRAAHGEHSKVTLVTEYCARGSLLDILALEDIKLDCLFISSLVHDLLRGMIFLHSHLGPHGNLKSSNCVVNSRWVLQITDYGLHDLRCESLRNLEREDHDQFDRHMLWRAPELLRAGIEVPGTKEGDVYSFAIILHEIIGRQGPYDTYEPDTDVASDIIRKLKDGSTVTGPPYRPDLNKIVGMPYGSDESVREAMQAAWEEKPADRPNFRTLKGKLKNMKDKSRKGNLMDHMMQMMEQYSKNLEELVGNRTQQLKDEQRKTEDLLHRMLPSSVAASLTKGMAVEPQGFDSVTIYFSDIVGFTSLSAESTAYEVVKFLNDLYTLFDNIIRGYEVYKVETIGDAYMVVSGLPKLNMGRHAGEIASMALELLDGVQNRFVIRHRPDRRLLLRIGLHTGPVIAGVVGLTMPRYCLFGDTVNTASRMESNGEPLRIHISKSCHDALEKLGGYVMEERGLVNMKGKGEVLTYWLNSATPKAIQRREYIESVSPPLLQLNEFEPETRRRSPRLSSLGCRTSSIHRSIEDPGDLNGGLPQLHHDEPRDSPRSDIFSYRRRFSNNLRTSSVDNTTRGSLLCPPRQESAPNIVHQSVSLDELHHPGVRLEVPALQNITKAASPSSSVPTIPLEDIQRGVNFCPSAADNEDVPATHCHGERDPMLNEGEGDTPLQGIYTGNNSPCVSGTESIRSSVIRWLNGLIHFSHSNARIPTNKGSLNGLKSESHV